jgi:hypothetical protein
MGILDWKKNNSNFEWEKKGGNLGGNNLFYLRFFDNKNNFWIINKIKI